ncbi:MULTISPECIES: VOC family protein [unclassified Caballeronia]|uniref:VOC family protein n=1 Tax=unclassified Caballeronia TaxID=2646786 RepID=UPI001F315FDA|nr:MULTISPECIES: VOC family protein [unclassified Caballeronia]MCE4541754.1 VOC family protein [Caballeronia sp. PC1]MCE4569202.1 VOC family protein [Caballeronia sp. CLC5]
MSDIPAADLRLCLRGVDHTARPTWRLKETVEFYRDVLGLPLIHTISARGWGPATHPDFLHFFFDSGNGSTIAFFHYLGSQEPEALNGRAAHPPRPDDHVFDATHTAWLVDTQDELQAWKSRLEARGVEVSVETAHEVIESIYFRDPNGYFIEITRKLRALAPLDARDAAATLEAAIELQNGATCIDEVWARKAARLSESRATDGKTLELFVLNVPEFSTLIDAARKLDTCRVEDQGDYTVISATEPVSFERRALGLKPAVWYGLFTGGLNGRIECYDRDVVRIAPRV